MIDYNPVRARCWLFLSRISRAKLFINRQTLNILSVQEYRYSDSTF